MSNANRPRYLSSVLLLFLLGTAAGLLLGFANGLGASPVFFTDEQLAMYSTREKDATLRNEAVTYMFERQRNERSVLLPLAMAAYIRLGKLAEFQKLFTTFRNECTNIGAYYGYIVMWAEELEKIGQPKLASECVDLLQPSHLDGAGGGATSMDLYCMRFVTKASVLGMGSNRAEEAINILDREVLQEAHCGERPKEAARELRAKIVERAGKKLSLPTAGTGLPPQ